MKTDILKKIIAEWFEESRIPPLVPRDYQGVQPEKAADILAVVGPRRSGKTYFMYQLIKSLLDRKICRKEDILFVDFEDFRLANFQPGDIETLITSFYQLAHRYPSYLFFDEIQRLPEWSRVIRTLHNQKKYKIIVSGSNSRLLEQEISTELRGRYRNILMLPFSFIETLRLRNISFSESTFHTPARGGLLGAFDQYLKEGGFPEILKAETLAEKRDLMQNYYRTIFYRDILERHNIKGKYILEAMMSHCLNTYSDLFSISGFEKHLKGHELPGSKRTISNYLGYLEEAFFLISHEKFSYSSRKRIMNPKKIYLLDTGFGFLSTEFSENRGKMLENIVAIELFRRREEAYYYRNKGECDFILKQGLRPASAIQVCWELNPRNRERELRGLVECMNALDIKDGFVLTYEEDSEAEYRGRKIPVVPVWKWLLSH
jgi:predicted AAA+ superfamily ATPase